MDIVNDALSCTFKVIALDTVDSFGTPQKKDPTTSPPGVDASSMRFPDMVTELMGGSR